MPVDVSHIEDWGKDLSRLEYRFICEYLIDLDDKLAGERLWPKINPAEARARGHRFLRKYHVGRAVDQALATDGGGSARTQVLNELRAIAFQNPKNLFKQNEYGEDVLKPIHELSDDDAKVIAGVEVETKRTTTSDAEVTTHQVKKIKISDKQSALDKMAKILGSHRPEQFDGGGVTVNVTVVRFSDELPVIEVKPNGHGAQV